MDATTDVSETSEMSETEKYSPEREIKSKESIGASGEDWEYSTFEVDNSNLVGKSRSRGKLKPLSKVWNYYVKVESAVDGKQRAKCLLCNRVVATGGGTTNLKQHLQHKHINTYRKVYLENDNVKTEYDSSAVDDVTMSSVNGISSSDISKIVDVQISKPPKKRLRKRAPSTPTTNIIPNIVSVPTTSPVSTEMKSAFHIFGELIGRQLELLPVRSALFAQEKIQRILIDALLAETQNDHSCVQSEHMIVSINMDNGTNDEENTA